jgi:hypothetical protein
MSVLKFIWRPLDNFIWDLVIGLTIDQGLYEKYRISEKDTTDHQINSV